MMVEGTLCSQIVSAEYSSTYDNYVTLRAMWSAPVRHMAMGLSFLDKNISMVEPTVNMHNGCMARFDEALCQRYGNYNHASCRGIH